MPASGPKPDCAQPAFSRADRQDVFALKPELVHPSHVLWKSCSVTGSGNHQRPLLPPDNSGRRVVWRVLNVGTSIWRINEAQERGSAFDVIKRNLKCEEVD